jgi:pyrroline-5-carboxylate reductase
MFGIIGVGNMGGAILRSAIERGVLRREETQIFDMNAQQALALKEELGVAVRQSCDQLIAACDMVLLAVKPDAVASLLAAQRENLKGKALICVAAGWRAEMLREAAGDGVRLLRVMPNTPLLVGEGMSVFSRAHSFTDDEAAFAERLFRALGRQAWAEECQMDAVTALSGSSPAFAYIFAEAMADAGVACGLPRAQSVEMAAQALLGSAKMVLESGMHPGALKDMVCSPSGTTIAGVRALEAHGFRSAVIEAVVAARDRAIALGS